MLVYEFYWRDKTGRDLFLATLKERRKHPERITEESILDWGRKVRGSNAEVGHVYFYISEVEEHRNKGTGYFSGK
jgi:hypothetical protein